MRKWIVILAAALLLSSAGCGKPAEDTAELPAAYAAYEAVPDFGALFKLEQYSRADMGEVSVFAYADNGGDFQKRCSLYAEAAALLGKVDDPVYWPSGQGCTLQCGETIVYLARHTESGETEDLTLILVMVGTEEQFIAANALVTIPITEEE